jgi:hypothetical protein
MTSSLKNYSFNRDALAKLLGFIPETPQRLQQKLEIDNKL